jgi:hypothetical protein
VALANEGIMQNMTKKGIEVSVSGGESSVLEKELQT